MTETGEAAAFWADMAGSAALWATRHSDALEYVDDFVREWTATMRDPYGRAVLETARQQTQAANREQGGLRCCGTTREWHRPWCEVGPRRFRGMAEAGPETARPSPVEEREQDEGTH